MTQDPFPMVDPGSSPSDAVLSSPPVTSPAPAILAPELVIPTAPVKTSSFDPRIVAKAQLVYPDEVAQKQQKQMIAQSTPAGAWGQAVPGRG